MIIDKTFVLEAIDTFEKHAPHISSPLKKEINSIRQTLYAMTEEQVRHEALQVETSKAYEQHYAPGEIHRKLYKVYPLMEKVARETKQYELLQAVNQLRGELGMATELYPDS
jgi:hypothetical protein